MVTIEYANNNKTLKYFDMAALLTLENNGKFYWYKVQKCTVLQYSRVVVPKVCSTDPKGSVISSQGSNSL